MDDPDLAGHIAQHGPLPFEEFQHMALYGPGGFFTRGTVKSTTAGDFLTSPEVSPWFGRGLAVWADRMVEGIEGPVRIIDVGAGSGSLLESMAAHLTHPAKWAAVEVPGPASEALAAAGLAVFESLGDVPSDLPEIVVANELVDNLVVALAVRTADGWEERWVGRDDGALALVAHPARPEVVDWAQAFGGDVPLGGLVEIQLAAGDWLRRLLARPRLVAALIIDYGDTAEGLVPRRSQGTLRTYRAHHLGPDPLLAPGETDITVDVNFSALLAIARDCGAYATLMRQDDFLAAQGLRDALSGLRKKELEQARDPDLAVARLQTRSEATGLETLLHPRGLGDFRVLELRPRGAEA